MPVEAALLGCFASGQFTWMSTWLPELFLTRIRATATGFIFNASRIPAALGVFVAGALIASLGGYSSKPRARTLGVNVNILRAKTALDFEGAFASLIELRASGLVIGGDPRFTGRARELAVLALRYRVPAIYQYPEFTAAGGLMSYGGRIRDVYHQEGVYVGRILKGENPAGLPVEQLRKVQLIINLKTAKTLGLTVPAALLARADEPIE